MIRLFKKYLKKYIELLTDDRDSFFIAIVDVEQELAERLLAEQLWQNEALRPDYSLVWFERRDYAEAVRIRNDKDIQKIVLLSSDSVKMIDSLKDFVEYPVIPEDKERLWQCIEAAFERELDGDCRKILEVVMAHKQVSIVDLLKYLQACTDINGQINVHDMGANLYYFDIWTLRNLEKKPVSKQHIQKVVRNSDSLLVEKKLMDGISESRLTIGKTRQTQIVRWLSKNNFHDIFKSVPYDKVENLFTGSIRSNKESIPEKTEEQTYEHSYKYALQEELEEDMEGLEEKLRQEQKEMLMDSVQMYGYPERNVLESCFLQLRDKLRSMNFPDRKKKDLLQKLRLMQEKFHEAVRDGREYTPAYLWHYANSQKNFVDHYFRFLGKCVADEGIAEICVGAGFLNALQNIFCIKKDNELHMPFYHPLVGIYYQLLMAHYEQMKKDFVPCEDDFISEAVQALMDKEQLNFPIQYMLYENELYQIDYTSLRKWGPEIIFTKMNAHVAGSWVDIRLLNKDLMDYIEREKFLPEIRVTIVDINDIKEVMFLVEKLRRIAESRRSMVNKVVLNIVSSKEEELKEQLQERMEIDLDYPQVLFRFTRELYLVGEAYDLPRIIKDSDLMFLADSNVLYQKPRLTVWKGDANWLRIRFGEMTLEKMLERYLADECCEMEILWDSIHHIEQEESVKMVCWNTQELKQVLLSDIRRFVQENPSLTIVIMSSNQQLLQHMYYIEGFQVRKSVMSGKEMLMVNFHAGSSRKRLKTGGEASVTISLKPFLEELLGVQEVRSILYADEDKGEEPCLTIGYRNGSFVFKCELGGVCEDLNHNEDRKKHYIQLVDDILKLSSKSRLFEEKWIAMLYEHADNYQTALMIDYMRRHPLSLLGEWPYEEKECLIMEERLPDSVDVLAFQGMLDFIRQQHVTIDEYAVNRFKALYRAEMLTDCLKADECLGFLEKTTKQKMKELYLKVEKQYE